jgi:hypothetical protein
VNFEKPKFNVNLHFPETPRGQELIATTFNLATRSLLETYPLLQTEYNNRVPKFEDIRFEPYSQVVEAEKKERPGDTDVDKQFKKDNLLQNSDYEDQVTPIQPVYWNPDTDHILHMGDNLHKASLSDSSAMRRVAALSIGLWVVSRTLNSLPVPQQIKNSDKTIWKEASKAHLSNMLKGVVPENIDPDKRKDVLEKLDKVKEITETYGIDNPHAAYYMYGAKLCIYLPEQTIDKPFCATYEMGERLNKGILEMLTEPVYDKFIKHLSYSFIIPGSAPIRPKPTEDKKYAQETLETIDELCLGKNNEQSLSRNKNVLLEAYAASLIPAYIYSSKAKEPFFNPLRYV